MGAVYLAKDLRFDDSYVALKKITIEFDKLDEKQQKLFRSAFEREANLLAKLNHESIPRVTDYFSESDSQYLVMELVDGDDLGALLGNSKKFFKVDEVLSWSFQILDALDYLHNQNPPIIHRDLKPANLKLTTRGKIKLLDFGIAKGTDGKSGNATTVTNHTFVGATLNYSPIEQLFRVIDPNYRDFIIEKFADKAINVLNQNADTRSDTFALGATFYHLTTGVLPNDALKRALDVWSGKPDPLADPATLNPEIEPELAEVLMRSLSTDVDARFSSAKEMSDALHGAVAAAKARKAKASTFGKGKKNSPMVDLSNLPIPVNVEETQPFFPQQMDLGEKTQVEPIFNPNIAETQVEPISNYTPVSNEPPAINPNSQFGQNPNQQETQYNSVTSTQEPKLDGATIAERPINDEVTRLPIANNADLTGVSYISNPMIGVKPTEQKTEILRISPELIPKKEKEKSESKPVGGFLSGLPKNSVLAVASTAGVGLLLSLFCIGFIVVPKFFGGGSDPIRDTSNTIRNSNYTTADSPTPPPVNSSTTENNNLSTTSNSDKSTTNTSSQTANNLLPKPDKTKPDAATPKPKPDAPTPKPKPDPTTAKPVVKKDTSPDCVYNGKCRN